MPCSLLKSSYKVSEVQIEVMLILKITLRSVFKILHFKNDWLMLWFSIQMAQTSKQHVVISINGGATSLLPVLT